MGNLLKIAQKRRSLILSTPFVWDADFQNVMDYATTEGIAMPSIATLKKANNLLVAMKNAEIWSKLDSFVNFSYNNTGADEFSLIDWKRLNEMTIHGGMTYTVNGWEANGTGGYIDTIYNATSDSFNFTQNNCSVFVTKKDITNYVAGTASDLRFRIENANTVNHRINGGNVSSALDGTGNGFLSLGRSSGTSAKMVNKDIEYSSDSLSAPINYENILMFRNTSVYSSGQILNFGISSNLSFVETQDFRTATNNYLTSIGLFAIA